MDVGRASVELLQTSVSGPTAVCFFCLDTFPQKGVCEIINAVDIFAVFLSVWSV